MEFEELLCTVCEEEYDTDQKVPRLLPDWGHTLCTEWLSQLLENAQSEGEVFACPEDRIPCSIMKPATEFPKNFSLLRIAQKKADSTPKKTEKPVAESGDLWPLHNRKLEVICVTCKMRICTNCALFGDHKTHDIREEGEVVKEITLRTELLIDIYELVEQNKNNLGDQKELDDMYNQFMTKQIALKKHVTNKFKEYYNEIMRKEKDVMNVLEKNFDSIESKFEEIKQGPKKVLESADNWCKKAQDKMDQFNSQNTIGDKSNFIAFEMLEDANNESDVIRLGEKVLEELDQQWQPPIPKIQEQLSNLSVQFDDHFKNKLMMMCHVPDLTVGESAPKFKNKPMNQLESSIPVTTTSENQAVRASVQKPTKLIQQPSNEKNLLDDDNDLLTSFTMTDKIGDEAKDLLDQRDEIDYLNDIPDMTAQLVDPSIVGDEDKAYDEIARVLENNLSNLDLSNRKLGDGFVASMIESMMEFSGGEPLSFSSLNLSGNDITEEGSDKICEFVIIGKDDITANLLSIDLSNNNIKDKASEFLLGAWDECEKILSINVKNNQFKSKLVINQLKGHKRGVLKL